jgi:hypothetical protein
LITQERWVAKAAIYPKCGIYLNGLTLKSTNAPITAFLSILVPQKSAIPADAAKAHSDRVAVIQLLLWKARFLRIAASCTDTATIYLGCWSLVFCTGGDRN